MKLFQIFIMFFSAIVFCQNLKKATYTITISENDRYKDAPADVKSILEKFDLDAEELHPVLFFNDTISVFKIEENVIPEYQGGAAIIGCNTPIFTLINSKINITSGGASMVLPKNKYIIFDSIKTNWNITIESKKIENFTCYKATQYFKWTNGLKDKDGKDKVFEKTVIAWFTPELPYSFGPKGYGGLPGLIVELQDENVLFGLEKLEKLTENIPIVLPFKGIKISHEEYNRILRKASESFSGGN